MRRVYQRPYRPLAVTYFDLKHHTFKAPGTAQREYTVLKVDKAQCLLQRLCDGMRLYLDTGRLLAIINGTY